MSNQRSTRREVRPDQPCRICGSKNKCSTGDDGSFFCRKQHGEVAGFKRVHHTEEQGGWSTYRKEDDPLLYGNQAGGKRPARPERAESSPVKIHEPSALLKRAESYAKALTFERKQHLASILQLPIHALDALPLLGWNARDVKGACWTFPEFDGEGNLVNLLRRWPSGDKWNSKGCTGGLCLPVEWGSLGGPLLLPEGASCTLTLRCLGLDAIGRPSNLGGIDALAAALASFPQEREIIVMGEMDAKVKEGQWPGLTGCKGTACELAKRLKRKVLCAMPPKGKDCRDWFVMHSLAGVEADQLERAGTEFVQALEPWDEAPPPEPEGPELITSTLEHVEEKVVRWLVPGYIPKGYLSLLCGDGKMGKGFITLSIAAALSRGKPCFGLSYPDYEPVESLFAAREDGRGDMLKPRLQALGADLSKIHFIDNVKYPAGKVQPFTLAEMRQLEKMLVKHPKIGYVCIDPIDSYIAATGVDDFKAMSVRESITDPLNAMCIQTDAAMQMVLHVNKGTGPKAVDRISGSKAYFTGVRVAFMCFPEPGSETIRGFTNPAMQMAPTAPSMRYRIALTSTSRQEAILATLAHKMSPEDMEAYRVQLAVVEWMGESPLDADSYCAVDSEPPENDQFEKQEAANWLRKHLANGALPGKACVEDGNAALEINGTMKWWRDVILKRKIGGDLFKGGFKEGWYWHLPGFSQKTPCFPEEAEEAEESEESEESKGG